LILQGIFDKYRAGGREKAAHKLSHPVLYLAATPKLLVVSDLISDLKVGLGSAGVSTMPQVILILLVAVFICVEAPNVQAQQSNAPTFTNTYESAVAKARETCATLWSDHALDPLRDKIPLGEQKPTFEMLKNNEKLKVKDRQIADLAVKALEKCRSAYADVYSLLPPQVSAMLHGVERQQDAIIAEIYRGKLTFGEFNIAMNRLNGELSSALSGIQTVQPTSAPREAPKDAVAARTAQQQPKLEQKDKGSIAPSYETRLALTA
jgi:hypothetical protein